MIEWNKAKLGEIASITSSKRIYANEYKTEGIPFYRGKEIIEKYNGHEVSTELFISRERYEEIKRKFDVPRQGDILLTSVGTLGIPWLVDEEEFYFKDGNLTWIRCNEKIVSDFLYLWLNSPEAKKQINSMCIGSTQKALTIEIIKKFDVSLPPLDVQKAICSMVNPISDKINVNNAINRNLQEQAKTIFKEWFIDNPNVSEWETGIFSDLVVSTLGGDWGKENETGNYTEQVYCVRGADIPEVNAGNKGKMPTRFILPKNYASKKLVAGDIVVEISGGSPTQSTGRVASISQSLLDRYDKGMVCTNFCRAIKPKPGYSMFIYYYWQYLYDKGVFFLYENGTTGIKNLDINGFLGSEKIVLPPKELVDQFDAFCQSIFNQIFKNGISIEKLADTRDTLLPKLMSGELDVSSIDI